jgi:hypothetical protein
MVNKTFMTGHGEDEDEDEDEDMEVNLIPTSFVMTPRR